MTVPRISVIVVSRGRSTLLVRCLAGLEQLEAAPCEVVVVADPPGLRAIDAAGFTGRVKAIDCDQANISAARNLGISAAAGEILAFIDDDAVPVPSWLTHLCAPFEDDTVAMAGGYVRGPDGLAYQHTGRMVDALGQHRTLTLNGDAPQTIKTTPGDALKTEGTNCAFRADILRAIGGFDPAFRFYLDETDVNLRLAARHAVGVIAPLAEVHHGFAASDRRLSNRMPTTLFEIGASQAVFLRKHAPDALRPGLDAFYQTQRCRLLRFMVAGLCEPRDVGRLLRDLEQGFTDGQARAVGVTGPILGVPRSYLAWRPRISFDGRRTLSGPMTQAARLRSEAAESVQLGYRTSLRLHPLFPQKPRVQFSKAGFWEHIGAEVGNKA